MLSARMTSNAMRLAALAFGVTLLTGCTLFSDDPRDRSTGTLFNDQVIESTVKRRIWNSDPAFDSSHLIAVSYNGVLLLAGQVDTADLKRRAEEIAAAHDKVRKVHNELQVGGPISMVARANDSWLTAKVKTRLLGAGGVKTGQVKVVTDNGVVYLMGMLPRAEADAAVEAASSVYGVQRIVKVFEYI